MGTWTLANRRGFATLERLADLSGTGIVLAGNYDGMPPGLSRSAQAMAIAETGAFALGVIIEAAGNVGGRRGQAKRVWKAMDPNSGADAAIFVAHGLAATTARLALTPGHHLSAERQDEARALLRDTFPWSDNDETLLREAAERIDPQDAPGLDDACVSFSFVAVAKILGEGTADLPGFKAAYADDPRDNYLAGLSWQICFNHALPPFLAMTDPQGQPHT